MDTTHRFQSGKRLALRRLPVAAATVTLLIASSPARAVDGCLVLLCLAAPNWRAIAQCAPVVTQVLRDLARGRPFPTCAMAGAGANANLQGASAPGNCPVQYVAEVPLINGVGYSCGFNGAITVNVDGAPWSRTWWNLAGQTVTEFSPTAKTRMGSWDTKFDDDYAAWLAAQPPALPPCPTC